MSENMTAEKFHKYCQIQFEGRTNMFHVSNVVALSGGILTQEDCFDIMKNYQHYVERFGRE